MSDVQASCQTQLRPLPSEIHLHSFKKRDFDITFSPCTCFNISNVSFFSLFNCLNKNFILSVRSKYITYFHDELSIHYFSQSAAALHSLDMSRRVSHYVEFTNASVRGSTRHQSQSDSSFTLLPVSLLLNCQTLQQRKVFPFSPHCFSQTFHSRKQWYIQKKVLFRQISPGRIVFFCLENWNRGVQEVPRPKRCSVETNGNYVPLGELSLKVVIFFLLQ
jgi:hypothetical protein